MQLNSSFKDKCHNFIIRMTGIIVFKQTIFPIIKTFWPSFITFIKDAIIPEKIGPQNQIKLIKKIFMLIFLWLIGGPPWY